MPRPTASFLSLQDCHGFPAGLDDVNLVLTDPPYNIGHKGGYGKISDNLPHQEYLSLMRQFALGAFNATTEDASLFVIHYPEFFLHNFDIFTTVGWKLHQHISWVYPSNIGHSKKRFTRAHRSIVWFVKTDTPKFVHKAVTQPYRNPTDKRIQKLIEGGAKGTSLYDWWEVNLEKNVNHTHLSYVNQLPESLVENIILSTTDVGDVVCDPFVGTGTTAKVAHRHGRIGVGCDINWEARRCWWPESEKRMPSDTKYYFDGAQASEGVRSGGSYGGHRGD